MAHDATGTLTLDVGEQSDRCIDMCKIVLRLRNLRLIGVNPTMDLGTFVLKCLDSERFRHSTNSNQDAPLRPAINLVRLRNAHPTFGDKVDRFSLEFSAEFSYRHCYSPGSRTPYLGVHKSGSSSSIGSAAVHGGHFKHGASITTLLADDEFRDLLFILRPTKFSGHRRSGYYDGNRTLPNLVSAQRARRRTG